MKKAIIALIAAIAMLFAVPFVLTGGESAMELSAVRWSEYTGIVSQKDGGLYTIESMDGSELFKIRHEVYDDDFWFPVGTAVIFSFDEKDHAEYKYSNLLLNQFMSAKWQYDDFESFNWLAHPLQRFLGIGNPPPAT